MLDSVKAVYSLPSWAVLRCSMSLFLAALVFATRALVFFPVLFLLYNNTLAARKKHTPDTRDERVWAAKMGWWGG